MNRIELLIKEKGFNMTSFAEKMNTTRQNLYAILKSPSYPTLEKVAEALDVPMWQLFASPEEVKNDANTITCPHCGGKFILTKSHVCRNTRIYEGKNTINKNMKKETIYNIAWNIRKEVEQCQKRGYFTSFPNGFCALSSIWIYDILCKKSHFVEIRQKLHSIETILIHGCIAMALM